MSLPVLNAVPIWDRHFLTIRAACEVSATGRTSLYGAMRSGALPFVKRGRRTLIRSADLRRWIEATEAAAA